MQSVIAHVMQGQIWSSSAPQSPGNLTRLVAANSHNLEPIGSIDATLWVYPSGESNTFEQKDDIVRTIPFRCRQCVGTNGYVTLYCPRSEMTIALRYRYLVIEIRAAMIDKKHFFDADILNIWESVGTASIDITDLCTSAVTAPVSYSTALLTREPKLIVTKFDITSRMPRLIGPFMATISFDWSELGFYFEWPPGVLRIHIHGPHLKKLLITGRRKAPIGYGLILDLAKNCVVKQTVFFGS